MTKEDEKPIKIVNNHTYLNDFITGIKNKKTARPGGF
jgi:hypothetical protein